MEYKYVVFSSSEHVSFAIGVVDDYKTALRMGNELADEMAKKISAEKSLETVKIDVSEETNDGYNRFLIVVNDEISFIGLPVKYYQWIEE